MIRVAAGLVVYVFIILDWITTLFGLGVGAVETSPRVYIYGMGLAMVWELVIISVLLGGVIVVDVILCRLNPSFLNNLFYSLAIGWGMVSLAPCFVVINNIGVILSLQGWVY